MGIEAAVGTVHEPQSIAARFHVEIRLHLAIHQQCIAEDFGHPRMAGHVGNWIVELAVGAQQAVADHERNLEFPVGQVKTTTCLMGVAVSPPLEPAANAGFGRVPAASRAVSDNALSLCKLTSSIVVGSSGTVVIAAGSEFAVKGKQHEKEFAAARHSDVRDSTRRKPLRALQESPHD